MQCAECGGPFTRKRSTRVFCGLRCQSDWMNRRHKRGAIFYDLVMAARFDRRRARSMKMTSAINRLASVCREEDARRRASRRSWRDPEAVLRDRPWLRTQEGRV